jgi:hypothetical protein
MGTGAAAAAQGSHEQSQVAPATPPSATQPCPYLKKLELGCFFDGTGNNMFDSGKAPTNVQRLYKIYSDQPEDSAQPPVVRQKNYLKGVGSGDATAPGQPTTGTGDFDGGAKGKGMKERCQMMYAWVKARVLEHSAKFTNDSLKVVDVYGFSRGSAQARTFVNLVSQALKKEGDTNDRLKHVEVRFVGIFDTVCSEHLGASEDQNLGIQDGTDFMRCYHPTARDEIRKNFPLTTIVPAAHQEQQYAGVHSDVGGGYGPNEASRPDAPKGDHRSSDNKTNELAYVTMMDMYQESYKEGVRFLKPLEAAVVPFSVDALTELKAKSYTPAVVNPNTPEGKAFRKTYVHDSATNAQSDNWSSSDGWSNAPEGSGKRRVLTAVRRILKNIPPNFSWTGKEPD